MRARNSIFATKDGEQAFTATAQQLQFGSVAEFPNKEEAELITTK